MSRKVLIVNNATGQRRTIETNATTWGGLRADGGLPDACDTGTRVYEGRSGSHMGADDELLPSQMRTDTGELTDDLTIFISPTRKIDSGYGRKNS